MALIEVRGEDLLEAGRVTARQRGETTTMGQYVGRQLARHEAFRGVLAVFARQYVEVLDVVRAGLRDEGDRAVELGAGFDTCHREFSAADELSRSASGRILEEVWARRPFELAGPSGDDPGTLARLTGAGADLGALQSSQHEVEGTLASLATEAGEASATVEDLATYRAFLDAADR